MLQMLQGKQCFLGDFYFFSFVHNSTPSFNYLCSMNNDITHWIENPSRDYAEGVRLLEKHSSNTHLVRVFANRSPRFAMSDLVAELRRLKPTAAADLPAATVTAQASKTQVPKVAEVAKQMVHEAWVKLSKNHRDLYAVGEGNSEKEMAARRILLAEREPLIERYNSIYEAKEALFAGVLTETQLQEVIDGKTIDQVLHPVKPEKVTLLASLSDLQLAKKAKAAKAVITRCKNQLRYQQDTAAKEDKPMPQCPRRKEIEQRMADKQAELATLEEELKKRS
jgi:hypothetical protein